MTNTTLRAELAETKRDISLLQKLAEERLTRAEQAERDLAEARAQRDQAITNFDNLAASFQKVEDARDRFAAVIAWQNGLLGYEPSHKVFEGWEREAIARHRAKQGGKQ